MTSKKDRDSSRREAQPCELDRRVGPTRDVIARRAYHIWESRGCPDGTAAEDWLQAETEIRQASMFRTGRREMKKHEH